MPREGPDKERSHLAPSKSFNSNSQQNNNGQHSGIKRPCISIDSSFDKKGANKENIDPTLSEKKRKVNPPSEQLKSPFSIPELANLNIDSTKKAVAVQENASKPPTTFKIKSSLLPSFEQLDHYDIDAPEDSNPLYCSEYVTDIFEHLKQKELFFLPLYQNGFQTTQTEINVEMRGVLIDWLIEVAEEFRFSVECLYLAKNYIDRYLVQRAVTKQKLQLIGVTCLLLAAKYEEVNVPNIDVLVEICDAAYSRQEILATEVEILKALDFTLSVVTENVFLDRYLRAASVGIRDVTVLNNLMILTHYLLELTLSSYVFVQYRPSLIASAAVSVALTLEKYYPWTPTLKRYTQFDWEDKELQSCINNLKALNAQQTTFERFSTFKTRYCREGSSDHPNADTFSKPIDRTL